VRAFLSQHVAWATVIVIGLLALASTWWQDRKERLSRRPPDHPLFGTKPGHEALAKLSAQPGRGLAAKAGAKPRPRITFLHVHPRLNDVGQTVHVVYVLDSDGSIFVAQDPWVHYAFGRFDWTRLPGPHEEELPRPFQGEAPRGT
jgi:hypothetical protein